MIHFDFDYSFFFVFFQCFPSFSLRVLQLFAKFEIQLKADSLLSSFPSLLL